MNRITRTIPLLAIPLAMQALHSAPGIAQGISVDPRPLLVIGMAEGPDAVLFQFLAEARILAGGELLVADRIAGDLRVFKRNGEHVRSFGRRGSGPAEFQHISGIAIRHDTIIVADALLSKLACFNLRGELLSTDPLPQPGSSLVGIGKNGRRWWSWMGGQVAGPASNITADSIAIGATASRDARVAPLAGAVVRWRFRGTPYPFSPVTRPTLLRDSLLLPDPLSGQLTIVDERGRSGRVLKIALRETDSSEAWKVLEQQMNIRQELRSRREWDIPRVDQLPRMAALLVDERDRIWIKMYDPIEDAHWLGGWAGGEGGEWLVVDATGAKVGTVMMPRRATPLYIGSDLLLARYRDEWDVQYLAAYQIR